MASFLTITEISFCRHIQTVITDPETGNKAKKFDNTLPGNFRTFFLVDRWVIMLLP